MTDPTPAPETNPSSPAGSTTPNSGGGGGKGGLVFALVIAVIAAVSMGFLWAQEKQKSQGAGDQSSELTSLRDQLAEAQADVEQREKELRRLQSQPDDSEERVLELEEMMESLRSEAAFAEDQREEASELLQVTQRDLNNFKQSMGEADARVAELNEKVEQLERELAQHRKE